MDAQLEIAKRVNLLDLVGKEIELRRESRDEWSGPCPKCGGTDRLHVRSDSFFCRQCRPEFGDAIDYVQWRRGLDFRGAVAFLAGGSTIEPTAPKKRRSEPQRKPQTTVMRADIGQVVRQAQGRLSEALPYLTGRGISEVSAFMFGLGYREDAPLPGTRGKRTAPAVVIPWYRGDKLIAVRYRFMEVQSYTDDSGKKREARLVSEVGSQLAGVLYGGHVLPAFCRMPVDENGKCAEQLRTLVIVEGELNAISIWQVAHGWNWDVLSIGSESQEIGFPEFISRYGRVMAWMDREEIVTKILQTKGGRGRGVPPQEADGKPQDANDLLRLGTLGDSLSKLRVAMCEDEQELTRVLYQLGRL